MNLPLSILSITPLNHNTFLLTTTKPIGFAFIPGHSCLLNLPNTEQSKARAFTFVSTNNDKHLTFLIKRSSDPESITHSLITSKPGEAISMTGLFGTHRATTPGTCIAAGIGIAPFLAIARSHPDIAKESTLIWSLKKAHDILYEDELRQRFKQVFITLTQEQHQNYRYGRITKELLQDIPLHHTQVCGSYEFNKGIKELIVLLTHQSE